MLQCFHFVKSDFCRAVAATRHIKPNGMPLVSSKGHLVDAGANEFSWKGGSAALWHGAGERQPEEGVKTEGASPDKGRNWVSNVKSQAHGQSMCYTHLLHLQPR